ncbi:hypothetical protein AAFF_G00434940 [Aldrovandia affinis]|uniref:Uncharacterized protein n=1 Tax=Aldrovandia affinis TaxID=143900 RepID=A0AAD7S899_9TELE|nr:hypothetical protein AAFF_G00434940 [Aldrovandia affinis]
MRRCTNEHSNRTNYTRALAVVCDEQASIKDRAFEKLHCVDFRGDRVEGAVLGTVTKINDPSSVTNGRGSGGFGVESSDRFDQSGDSGGRSGRDPGRRRAAAARGLALTAAEGLCGGAEEQPKSAGLGASMTVAGFQTHRGKRHGGTGDLLRRRSVR